MKGPTNTDAGVDQWLINDDVVRLRLRGGDQTYLLPSEPSGEWDIGSSVGAWLRLDDVKGRVSRKHATLARVDGGKWVLRDAGSKNGMMVGGAKRDVIELEPGREIWVGGVTLIAESGRLIALRGFLGRILGWTSNRTELVDLALRSIRLAATREIALVVCGDDVSGHEDVVQIARALHRHALGDERPFIVCDPRRKQSAENVRAAENYTSGMDGLRAAKNGSLCIWSQQLPADFHAVKVALRDPDTRVQLVVCAREPVEAEAFGAVPITVPSLAHRPLEVPRIIEEYASDAMAELGLARAAFPRDDQAWVLTHEAMSLVSIEKATLRLRALRDTGGNVAGAAARLGMARQSLARWIGRRKLPLVVDQGDA